MTPEANDLFRRFLRWLFDIKSPSKFYADAQTKANTLAVQAILRTHSMQTDKLLAFHGKTLRCPDLTPSELECIEIVISSASGSRAMFYGDSMVQLYDLRVTEAGQLTGDVDGRHYILSEVP